MLKRTVIVLVGLWISILGQADARTSTNRWQGATAKWETTKQWSLNKLPSASQDIVIASPGTFTVTIDDQTASSFPTAMAISSLSMSNTAGLNTLLLTNRPTSTTPITLTISNSASIGPGSILDLVDASSIGAGVDVQASNLTADATILLASNATLSVNNSLLVGSTVSRSGVMNIIGGTLIGSPNVGNGSLLISDGVLQASFVNVGVVSGAHGVWQIAGGSNVVNGSVAIGGTGGATGEVVIAGGKLIPNGNIYVGEHGVGRLVTSNGLLQAEELDLGQNTGGHGTWQIAGGSNNIAGNLRVGGYNGGTGEVVVTGGQLSASDFEIGGEIGVQQAGVGSLVLSNGSINAYQLHVGGWFNGVGTITVAGGTLQVYGLDDFRIGNYGTGVVWQTGGEIDITNAVALKDESSVTYLSQLVCSGGVLRATEVDVGHPDIRTAAAGSSLWTIAGGTTIVSRAVYVVNQPNRTGLLTISGGLLQTPSLELGTVSGGGAVVVSGGVLQVANGLVVGEASGQPSHLSIAGGNLNVGSHFGSFPAYLGSGGSGEVVVSSGSLTANTLWIGLSSGSVGTLTVSGGLVDSANGSGMALFVGEASGSTGIVSYAGGNLHATSITVGDLGVGSMSVTSNADFQSTFLVIVGNQNGAVGSLSLQGGKLFGSPSRAIPGLQIGVATGSTGTLWVTDGALQAGQSFGCLSPVLVGGQGSGRLSATNSDLFLFGLSVGSQGTFECVNSQVGFGDSCSTANSNSMVFVNSTGAFSGPVENVGRILVNGSTLTFSQPVDNSGLIVLTNGFAQFSGGINNTGSVLLGPDKFIITLISATGSDVAMAWPVFGGNHYRVQAAGSLTDSFVDITADIVPPADLGFGVTNYLDAGGLTNSANRFYRIRQIY